MEITDLLDLCRLCRANYETATLVDIFEQREREEWQGELEPSLPDMIQLISDNYVIAPGDALPQKVCLSCILSVVNSYRFKRMCEESHVYFFKYVLEMQDAHVKVEPVADQEQESIHKDNPLSMLTHNFISPEERFQCSYCGKGFISKSQMIRHKRIHTDERPFKCAECPRVFNQRGRLRKHRLREHKNEPQYTHSCPSCNKMFAKKHDLTSHLRMHSGERRPFQCSQCLHAFKEKHHLKKHMRQHASPLDTTLHQCPLCGKSLPSDKYICHECTRKRR